LKKRAVPGTVTKALVVEDEIILKLPVKRTKSGRVVKLTVKVAEVANKG